ncbi:hypothetical protein HaLaN_12442 [Haematococcus lacustris]|uniref:Uncharacterized protein n=1 Tax=Haematococcus lacustris TaxID=44745 RepID=A0A699Z3D6_HAELA|nr:hypothetical protein HaLaN_12442 [Haematococcus lacustris]
MRDTCIYQLGCLEHTIAGSSPPLLNASGCQLYPHAGWVPHGRQQNQAHRATTTKADSANKPVAGVRCSGTVTGCGCHWGLARSRTTAATACSVPTAWQRAKQEQPPNWLGKGGAALSLLISSPPAASSGLGPQQVLEQWGNHDMFNAPRCGGWVGSSPV